MSSYADKARRPSPLLRAWSRRLVSLGALVALVGAGVLVAMSVGLGGVLVVAALGLAGAGYLIGRPTRGGTRPSTWWRCTCARSPACPGSARRLGS